MKIQERLGVLAATRTVRKHLPLCASAMKNEKGGHGMPRKNERNTRGRIIAAAWKLFYQNGYDETTVEDIVFESQTSRGSFYHYFQGKDALIGTLAYLFDDRYEQLAKEITPDSPAIDTLIHLNHEVFVMIEEHISMELLTRLLSTQLTAQGAKHLLDGGRFYFKLLRRIIRNGQKNGQLRTDMTESEIVRAYALWERALMYDWCLNGGDYSLVAWTDKLTPTYMRTFAAQQ